MHSKTLLLSYLQCPEYFWYKIHMPEVLAEQGQNDFEQMLADQCKMVEAEFYKLFPGVSLVQSMGFDSVAETKELEELGSEYIAQAGFVTDEYFAQADLTHFHDGVIDIHEIKSSSSMQNMGLDDGPPTQSREEHVTDSAFQYILATKEGHTVILPIFLSPT